MYDSLAALTLVAALTVSACGNLTGSGPHALPESDGLLQTDRTTYEARLVTDGPARVVVEIPYALANTTADTLYLIGCRRPPQPAVQKYVNEAWTTVYTPVELMCLSPPWKVAPGTVRHDTLRMEGALPDQNAAPTFDAAEIEGTYRLVRGIYRDSTGAKPLPEDRRTSNAFVLTTQ